ncbi:hypothetical protein WR25_24525 [Diploscapter pachys]|uniref:Uncharacterized protein n=1 Tax=Diploscapter pachys TaxID=2018661 RepID=A0A2A2M5D1_9BILA|nr:hypothetical protein WR25_24525 [Diploscapter pachys]
MVGQPLCRRATTTPHSGARWLQRLRHWQRDRPVDAVGWLGALSPLCPSRLGRRRGRAHDGVRQPFAGLRAAAAGGTGHPERPAGSGNGAALACAAAGRDCHRRAGRGGRPGHGPVPPSPA